MWRRTLLVTATVVAAVACADAGRPTTSTASYDTGSPAADPGSPDADTGPDIDADAGPDAVLVATVEEQLAGTDYEGLALADPAGFVATGEVMCDLLDGGATVDEVLSAYLVELEAAREGMADDDAVLSGAVLGAAVGTLCPQHTAALAGG